MFGKDVLFVLMIGVVLFVLVGVFVIMVGWELGNLVCVLGMVVCIVQDSDVMYVYWLIVVYFVNDGQCCEVVGNIVLMVFVYDIGENVDVLFDFDYFECFVLIDDFM